MGQDEDAQPLVRRADFCRAEQARRRRLAHAPKLSQDGFKAEGDVTGNVFEKDPFRGTFPDDTGDLGVDRHIGLSRLLLLFWLSLPSSFGAHVRRVQHW